MLNSETSDQLSGAIMSSLPDYSLRFEADSIEQLQLMKYLNKVILFTTKDQSPPILKALSARYKNRILVMI